jgi:hypothetical protein
MNTQQEQEPRTIQVRKTPRGWNVQLDSASWAELMTGLSIAIESCEQGLDVEWAEKLRALRSAISKG